MALGNIVQAYTTLHYIRRLYPGRFVANPRLGVKTAAYEPQDSVHRVVPAPAQAKHAVDQVTPLAARCFGTYTFVVAMVRLYAAYNLHVAPVYDMALWTYAIALLHFGSEMLVYKTMDFGLPQFFPFAVSTGTLLCMPLVRSHYVLE